MPMPDPAPKSNDLSPASIAPPTRDLVKKRAYDELKSRFLSNQYKSGTYLSERQLAAELGMSKTPIKAALERLEMEGFISVSPQVGIVVLGLSDKEIADLFEFRVALECYVLRALSGKLDQSQKDQWQVNLEGYTKVASDSSAVLEFVAYDTEFHLLPSRFLGNLQILQSMQRIYDRIRMVTTEVFTTTPSRAIQSAQEHAAIMQAVIDGDSEKASQLAERHLWVGHDILSRLRQIRS